MNDDTTEAKNPRRIMVYFWDDPPRTSGMIKDDNGNRLQLIEEQKIWRPPSPSLFERFRLRLSLNPRPSKETKWANQTNDQAVAKAHEFVSSNYQSGHQVILVGDESWPGDHIVKATETLVQYLYNGKVPSGPSEIQLGETSVPIKHIPIYGVVVPYGHYHNIKSLSLMNDQLIARFPPGVKHIICLSENYTVYQCCSTVFDSDGGIVSRQISIHSNGSGHYEQIFKHYTKHIIYYENRALPDWDAQTPIWTKVLDSSPSGIPRGFPSSTQPAGIYRQELRCYKGGLEGGGDRLVWKSFRQ